MSARSLGARLERVFSVIMPLRASQVQTAFGHPRITGESKTNRAAAIYELANACPFKSVAVQAIDYADSVLMNCAPLIPQYRQRWVRAVQQAWEPAANYRPVSSEVKLLKKGSPNVPTSVRYIGHQLERAAKVGPTNVNNELLRDILRAWCLGTFGDPRPVHIIGRARLLRTSHVKLYAMFLADKKASELYAVIHQFTAGLSNADPILAWSLPRHCLGISTALPTHSYTAIVRRVLAPKKTTETVFQGVCRAVLQQASFKMLQTVTAGGTSKRVKSALLSLPDNEQQSVRAAVTALCPHAQVPLDQAERARHNKLPPTYVLWCAGCMTWRASGCLPKGSGPLVCIDLLHPNTGVCGACGHWPLQTARLNGTAIGPLRMCSLCGIIMQTMGEKACYGTSVICKACAAAEASKSRPCALCSTSATDFVVAAGSTAFTCIYLCGSHYPGATELDPLTPVHVAMQHLKSSI